jgi:hypothetical protein
MKSKTLKLILFGLLALISSGAGVAYGVQVYIGTHALLVTDYSDYLYGRLGLLTLVALGIAAIALWVAFWAIRKFGKVLKS